MSIEIREIKVVGNLKRSDSNNNIPANWKKELHDSQDKIVEICVNKVLKRLEKIKRR